MSTIESASPREVAPRPYRASLRRLYLARSAFAVVWAALLLAHGPTTGPWLTVLLVGYPLFDAGAVLWQIRARADAHGRPMAQGINVVVSAVVAIALGVASAGSIGAVLGVWGAWAIGAGIPQLVVAVRDRGLGGQVPQMLSGGISVLAGASFLGQGLTGADSVAGIGGYALVGALFFLLSALRLGSVLRRTDADGDRGVRAAADTPDS